MTSMEGFAFPKIEAAFSTSTQGDIPRDDFPTGTRCRIAAEERVVEATLAHELVLVEREVLVHARVAL